MSMHRSLKTASSLRRYRNVLSRSERIVKLVEAGKFKMGGDDPLGLPKVAHRKAATGGKKKAKETTEEAAPAS